MNSSVTSKSSRIRGGRLASAVLSAAALSRRREAADVLGRAESAFAAARAESAIRAKRLGEGPSLQALRNSPIPVKTRTLTRKRMLDSTL